MVRYIKIILVSLMCFSLVSCSGSKGQDTNMVDGNYVKDIDIVIDNTEIIFGETQIGVLKDLLQDFDLAIKPSGLQDTVFYEFKSDEYMYDIYANGNDDTAVITKIKIYYKDVVSSNYLVKGFDIKKTSYEDMVRIYGPAIKDTSMAYTYVWFLNENKLRIQVHFAYDLDKFQEVEFKLVD